jgi:hypothetical protein
MLRSDATTARLEACPHPSRRRVPRLLGMRISLYLRVMISASMLPDAIETPED